MLELLFDHPAVTVGFVSEKTGVSFSQAGKLCAEFEKLGLVRETTGQKRNRQFRFQGLLDAFQAHDPG